MSEPFRVERFVLVFRASRAAVAARMCPSNCFRWLKATAMVPGDVGGCKQGGDQARAAAFDEIERQCI